MAPRGRVVNYFLLETEYNFLEIDKVHLNDDKCKGLMFYTFVFHIKKYLFEFKCNLNFSVLSIIT